MHVHHALAAIYAGIINVALVTHGEAGYSARANGGRGRGGGGQAPDVWSPSCR